MNTDKKGSFLICVHRWLFPDYVRDGTGKPEEPLKEDNWIGPKTTDAFNLVSRTAKPDDFASEPENVLENDRFPIHFQALR